ncbi:MAG: translation initiation factor IF-2 subunit alpha [Candidatus Lokiarchaeota archaeon]|nr:translation initiation factor IF-2 subunit alpha [Candidatus Lokiarchaeota archaeon]
MKRMVLKRAEWPNPDEYVVAVASKVTPYGAYVMLPEYGDKEGFIHISEVSSTWVRNIRNHIQENQRIVVRVLKVDSYKEHIDCSLRRVSAEAKKAKNNEWKRSQKAEKLLELIAKDSDMSLEEVYEAIGWPMEDYFGEIYTGLERIADIGISALDEIDADKKLKEKISELAESRIEIPSVEIDGDFTIQVPGSRGVEVIREALTKGLEIGKKDDKSSVEIYTLGAPRYKIRITSPDYKDGEDLLSAIREEVTTLVEKEGGKANFERKD